MNLPLSLMLLILFSGSILYNEAVATVNVKSKGDYPLAAAAVAVGVMYTLFAAWLVDGTCMSIWTILWCFVASGSPMLAGDVFR